MRIPLLALGMATSSLLLWYIWKWKGHNRAGSKPGRTDVQTIASATPRPLSCSAHPACSPNTEQPTVRAPPASLTSNVGLSLTPTAARTPSDQIASLSIDDLPVHTTTTTHPSSTTADSLTEATSSPVEHISVSTPQTMPATARTNTGTTAHADLVTSCTQHTSLPTDPTVSSNVHGDSCIDSSSPADSMSTHTELVGARPGHPPPNCTDPVVARGLALTAQVPGAAHPESSADQPPATAVEGSKTERVSRRRQAYPFIAGKELYDKSLPRWGPYEQVEQQARNHFLLSRQLEADPRRCARCWVVKRWCFCAQMDTADLRGRYRIVLYMHYMETTKARASNTGKLLLCTLPNTWMVVCGIQEQEAALLVHIKRLQAKGKECLVLFPSRGALTPAQFLAQQSQTTQRAPSLDSLPQDPHDAAGTDGGGGDSSDADADADARAGAGAGAGADTDHVNSGAVGAAGGAGSGAAVDQANREGAGGGTGDDDMTTIIVLDGTWSYAKTLNRRISRAVKAVGARPLPRLTLAGSFRAQFGATRKMYHGPKPHKKPDAPAPIRGGEKVAQGAQPKGSSKVSTMGAVVQLLLELGESEETVAPLGAALRLAVEAYRMQCPHKAPLLY